jgi:hypothetical protein
MYSETHTNNKFERNHVDKFIYDGSDLGNLRKLRIGHDSAGINPSWHLHKVEVHAPSLGKQWVFPCRKWLSKSKDDGKTERMLLVADEGGDDFWSSDDDEDGENANGRIPLGPVGLQAKHRFEHRRHHHLDESTLEEYEAILTQGGGSTMLRYMAGKAVAEVTLDFNVDTFEIEITAGDGMLGGSGNSMTFTGMGSSFGAGTGADDVAGSAFGEEDDDGEGLIKTPERKTRGSVYDPMKTTTLGKGFKMETFHTATGGSTFGPTTTTSLTIDVGQIHEIRRNVQAVRCDGFAGSTLRSEAEAEQTFALTIMYGDTFRLKSVCLVASNAEEFQAWTDGLEQYIRRPGAHFAHRYRTAALKKRWFQKTWDSISVADTLSITGFIRWLQSNVKLRNADIIEVFEKANVEYNLALSDGGELTFSEFERLYHAVCRDPDVNLYFSQKFAQLAPEEDGSAAKNGQRPQRMSSMINMLGGFKKTVGDAVRSESPPSTSAIGEGFMGIFDLDEHTTKFVGSNSPPAPERKGSMATLPSRKISGTAMLPGRKASGVSRSSVASSASVHEFEEIVDLAPRDLVQFFKHWQAEDISEEEAELVVSRYGGEDGSFTMSHFVEYLHSNDNVRCAFSTKNYTRGMPLVFSHACSLEALACV